MQPPTQLPSARVGLLSFLKVGVGIGFILEHTNERGLGTDLSVSLDTVRFMNPEIIFYALLPALIFESAFFTDVHIFLRETWQVKDFVSRKVPVRSRGVGIFLQS